MSERELGERQAREQLARERERRAAPPELGAYAGADGRTLRYAVVRAPRERHVLVYLHGIESHGGWFALAAEELAARGCTTYLLDRRGSGLNLGEGAGDARSSAELLDDVRRFRAHLGLDHVVLVGLSWGGKLALAAALDAPRGVRALVLVTPGIVPRVRLPAAQTARLLVCWLFRPRARFAVPIEPEMFTRTPRWLAFVREDPLRVTNVTARFLRASVGLGRFVRARIRDLRAPVLLLLAEHDRIVHNARTRALLERAREAPLRVRTFAGATHSLQLDQRAELAADVAAFLEELPC